MRVKSGTINKDGEFSRRMDYGMREELICAIQGTVGCPYGGICSGDVFSREYEHSGTVTSC